jgi:hypothetical protein
MNIIIQADENKIIQELRRENKELKERLQKYTNPKRHQKYYNKNKDKILEKTKERYYKNKEENKS